MVLKQREAGSRKTDEGGKARAQITWKLEKDFGLCLDNIHSSFEDQLMCLLLQAAFLDILSVSPAPLTGLFGAYDPALHTV